MMTTRDPSPLAILSARIMRAYPSLSPFSCASLAEELASIERAQRRHAERCCSGEDGGYVRRVAGGVSRIGRINHPSYSHVVTHPRVEHDPDAEQRAGARIAKRVDKWKDNILAKHALASDWSRAGASPFVTLHGDPRGRVLLLQLPGESEPT